MDLGNKKDVINTIYTFTFAQINVSSVAILVVDKRESLVIEKVDD
jgi:hypothetical protein